MNARSLTLAAALLAIPAIAAGIRSAQVHGSPAGFGRF